MPQPSVALRLLVVTSRPAAVREVLRALGGRLDEAEVRWVSRAALAPFRARDFRPRLILLYDDLGDERLVALVRRLVRQPGAGTVFAVVSPARADLARRAVFSGAGGFLLRPLTQEQLAPLLRDTEGPRPPVRAGRTPAARGHVIVFCSPKGGTGRTTLAVNTAIAIRALTGQGVILVDADYAAPAVDVALDLRDAPDVSLLLPRLGREDDEFLDAVLVPHSSGVRALLAPPPAAEAAPKTPAQVRGILQVLRGAASWIAVDLGLPADDRAWAFLASADRAVINVLPEAIGLRNARRLLESLWERGLPEGAACVVLNRAEMHGGLAPEEIRDHLKIPVSFEVPDDQALATASVNRGAPIVVDYRYTAVASAVRELARRLITDVTGVDPLHGARRTRARRALTLAAAATAVALVVGVGAVAAVWSALPPGRMQGFLARLREGVGVTATAAPLPATSVPAPQTAPSLPATPAATALPAAGADPPPPTEPAVAAPSRGPTAEPLPSVPLSTAAATPAPPHTFARMPVPAGVARAPALLEPTNGASVPAGEVLHLSWTWHAELGEGALFAITMAYRQGGTTRYVDLPWLAEPHCEVPEDVLAAASADEGRFFWAVMVVERTGTDAAGSPMGVPLSAMSEVRTFVRATE